VTQAEWLAATDLRTMIDHLTVRVSDDKPLLSTNSRRTPSQLNEAVFTARV
jgi:hypothetical protein